MAEKKNQGYPLRFELSPPAPVQWPTVALPAPQAAMRETPAFDRAAARSVFAALPAVAAPVAREAPADAYSAGRAVARGAGMVGQVAQGIANPTLAVARAAPAMLGRVAAPLTNFAEGVVGVDKGYYSKPATKVAAAKAAPQRQAGPTSEQQAARVAAVATAQASVPTAQTRALEFLDKILQQPLTIGEYTNLAGTLPQIASATGKGPSAKDQVLGSTAKISQDLFANEVAQAQELAKTDPDSARALTARALTARFQRDAGLVGFNPAQMAQAQLLQMAQDEDN